MTKQRASAINAIGILGMGLLAGGLCLVRVWLALVVVGALLLWGAVQAARRPDS